MSRNSVLAEEGQRNPILGYESEETSLMPDFPSRYSSSETEPQNQGSPASHNQESFFEKYKRVKSESNSFIGFVWGFLALFLSTVFATVLLFISLAIPVAMLVIGVIYKDDCSGEDMIPIYLIVAGAFGIARVVVSLGGRICQSTKDSSSSSSWIEKIFNLFLFAWFVTGCVYIYRFYYDVQHDFKTDKDYCDYTLYWFAFWINTAHFIILGVALLSCCILCCCIRT